MDRTRQALAAEFAETVTMSRDRVLAVSDRIQQKRWDRADLTAQCKFERSMQVRRLKTLAPRNWNPTDWRNAEAVLTEIAHLAKGNTPAHTLALAVLGVERKQLPKALALLEQTQTEDAGE